MKLFGVLDRLLFTLERLWQHRILVLWALVGLSVATTLALSLMLYIDAVNTGLLASHLGDPPYAFRFRYLGAWEGNITHDDVESASAAVHERFIKTIGLPIVREVGYVRGKAWTVRLGDNQPLGACSVGMLDGVEDQITITAGNWPAPAADDEPLPVLISETMLYTMGVQVGDTLIAARPGAPPLEMQVAALWRALDPDDPLWVFPPKFFDSVLLIQPDDFWRALEGIDNPVEESAWYLVFDGEEVRTSDVDTLLGRIVDGQRDIAATLPGIRPDLSPEDSLRAFSAEVSQLTQQLIIVILPVGGLALYFVALVAGLLVGRQQGEDVALRSRGMSRRAILGVHLLMWLIMVGVALVVGVFASPVVVRLVGQTSSFLRFDLDAGSDAPLTVVFTPQALAAGTLTGLIAASSGLYMAWRTSRQTITSFRQGMARASKAWWQRVYLDVLLLIPALYVLFTLWRQGGLVLAAEDAFSDPLVFLGPTLFALSLTLLFLRLWPYWLRLGAAAIAYTRNITLLMALRELSRAIGRYRGTLLMMCFTLSLTGFTASMASTLDRSLEDSVNYKIGADTVMVMAVDAQTEEGEVDADTGQQTYEVIGFNTLPAADLLEVDGVYQVARVGRYSARLVLTSQRLEGTAFCVDRASMSAVTRFRADYADMPVADLFNLLAGQSRNGVLLSKQTAVDYNLRTGQEITVEIQALNTWYQMKMPIVGLLDYFPTLDPHDGFFLLANLQPVFETIGTELPYDIWLGLTPDADTEAMQQGAREQGFPVLEWRDPQAALTEAQAAPARRGVLGFLSVGFVATILLTLVGAIIQSSASFRAQTTQLGSLRAMGLGGLSVAAYMILLQGMTAASGILSGMSFGVATALLFLPLMDFSGGLPPYLVRVAWNEILAVYAFIGGVLFVITLLTTLLLGRERVATVLRIGDV
jgi:putative ABC transport system permease protein